MANKNKAMQTSSVYLGSSKLMGLLLFARILPAMILHSTNASRLPTNVSRYPMTVAKILLEAFVSNFSASDFEEGIEVTVELVSSITILDM